MKIALLGFGKMGKTIERIAEAKGHNIVCRSNSTSNELDLNEAEVAIEFSSPEAAVHNLSACFKQNVPVVSGTTGWLDRYSEMVKLCESSNGSFIYASNFSIGVNLFFSMNEYVAQLMSTIEGYEVGMKEIHHTQKKDAPSGTAISLAEGIIKNSSKVDWRLKDDEKTDENVINIEAKRIEDVKGTHRISYTSEVDTITLQHEAYSRDGFALGAILAAEWLVGKTGVYSMKDVLHIGD